MLKSAGRRWLSIVASLALLVLTAWFVDVRKVVAALSALDARWALASFAFQGAQIVILAVRWHWVSRQLQLQLPFTTALSEYVLSTSLNLLLPGGFLGDVSRGYRHGKRTDEQLQHRVWLGVIADRLLGQLGLWSLAVASVYWWVPANSNTALWVVGATVVFLLGVLALSRWLGRYHRGLAAGLYDLGKAVVRPSGFSLQLSLAAVLFAAWISSFYCASRALGFETQMSDVCRGAVPALLAASIPGFVNGWGAREGAAALAYTWAGMSASEGSSVSLTYGLVGVVLALTGLGFVLLRRLS